MDVVKYLMELGAETSVGDVGSRCAMPLVYFEKEETNCFCRTPADLAVLKAMGQEVGSIEQNILDIFREEDDILFDFEFTPIHKAALRLYDARDSERPSLEQ